MDSSVVVSRNEIRMEFLREGVPDQDVAMFFALYEYLVVFDRAVFLDERTPIWACRESKGHEICENIEYLEPQADSEGTGCYFMCPMDIRKKLFFVPQPTDSDQTTPEFVGCVPLQDMDAGLIGAAAATVRTHLRYSGGISDSSVFSLLDTPFCLDRLDERFRDVVARAIAHAADVVKKEVSVLDLVDDGIDEAVLLSQEDAWFDSLVIFFLASEFLSPLSSSEEIREILLLSAPAGSI